MPTFGKRSNQRQAGGGGFEMFIKTFDEGAHRVTVLEDQPEQWLDVYEHYDHALKLSFPCAKAEGADGCIGCDYPVEHEEWSDLDTHFPGLSWSEQRDARKKADVGWSVRDTGRRWLLVCIDDKNYISIYKISKDVWESFCSSYSALGTLLETEFIVDRKGKGFGTTIKVTAVPGEVRKPKYAVPGEVEVQAALGRKYLFAMEKYGIDPPEEGQQPDPAPVQQPESTGDAAADALAAHRAQAAAKGKTPTAPTTGPAAGDEAQQPDPAPAAPPAAEQPPAEAEQVPVNSPAHGFIPREASAGDIKDWLDTLEPAVEYNPRAARGALVKLAEETMKDRGILPY